MAMEENPIPESPIETPEDLLVRQVQEGGLDASIGLLSAWSDEQERSIEQLSGREYVVAQIELERRRGRLYFRIGCIDEARTAFDNARYQAQQENMPELYAAIMAEMDVMEASLNE